MSKVAERLHVLRQRKLDKLNGKLQLIPFYHHLPKLGKVIPGIFRRSITTLMAGTGDGKSKFTKYMTILIPYWLSLENGLEYKTIYFALEESEEEFIDSLFIMLLHTKYGIDIDYATLNSYREEAIGDDILEKMDECSKEVDDILRNVIVIDDVSNPTGK